MRRSALIVSGLLALLWSPAALPNPQTQEAAKIPPLDIPGDTTLLARLTANLDLGELKIGDEVRIETSEDVKNGKTVLLKKGSMVVGHVSFVEPASNKQTENTVGILFDQVRPKNGTEHSLTVVIRALAPQTEVPSGTTIAGGRGMPGETDKAGISGRDHADTGGIAPLSTSSVGVSNIPGLEIGMRKPAGGQRTSVLTWSKEDIKLKKGYQAVLLVVGQ
jgi:hypothetical protein